MALPLAQNLTQLTNYWLNEMNQYEPILYFDLDTLVNLMEKEPLALTAVAIAFLNIVFTIFFKVSDYFKELWKRSGCIEAHRLLVLSNKTPRTNRA